MSPSPQATSFFLLHRFTWGYTSLHYHHRFALTPQFSSFYNQWVSIYVLPGADKERPTRQRRRTKLEKKKNNFQLQHPCRVKQSYWLSYIGTEATKWHFSSHTHNRRSNVRPFWSRWGALRFTDPAQIAVWHSCNTDRINIVLSFARTPDPRAGLTTATLASQQAAPVWKEPTVRDRRVWESSGLRASITSLLLCLCAYNVRPLPRSWCSDLCLKCIHNGL